MKETALAIYAFVALLSAALLSGQIIRGESSPWFWVELAKRHPTSAEVALEAAGYLFFYSCGYFVPFLFTSLAFHIVRQRLPSDVGYTETPQNYRRGRILLSCGFLTLFLIFLDPLVAFVRALPIGIWNGWILIGGLFVAGYFMFLSYKAFCSRGMP